MDLHQRVGVNGRESPTAIIQAKRTQMPSSPIPVSSVVHVSPADTGSARVSVSVVTISPAASGGLTCRAREYRRDDAVPKQVHPSRGGREMLAAVSRIYDFRNTRVAHQEKEITDPKEAQQHLIGWIKDQWAESVDGGAFLG
jgi:hypothetical protein